MDCGVCQAPLKITHTYRAGPHGKAQTGKCGECGRLFTIVSVVVGESTHGRGAYAIAEKMKAGDGPRVAA